MKVNNRARPMEVDRRMMVDNKSVKAKRPIFAPTKMELLCQPPP